MQRVDPPYPSLSAVVSSPKTRSTRSHCLPAYRSSYLGRYHPYPMTGRASCQERLTSSFDNRYEEELLREEQEPLVVPLRTVACTEVLDSDASPFEDDPLRVEDVESGIQHAPNPAAAVVPSAVKLIGVLTAFLAAVQRRYFARLRGFKDFLLLEQ